MLAASKSCNSRMKYWLGFWNAEILYEEIWVSSRQCHSNGLGIPFMNPKLRQTIQSSVMFWVRSLNLEARNGHKTKAAFSTTTICKYFKLYVNILYQQQPPLEGKSVVTTIHPSSKLPVFEGVRFQMLPGRQGWAYPAASRPFHDKECVSDHPLGQKHNLPPTR